MIPGKKGNDISSVFPAISFVKISKRTPKECIEYIGSIKSGETGFRMDSPVLRM